MFFISLFSLVFIISLSRSIYSLWQKGSVILTEEQIRSERQKENAVLKQKLALVQSSPFIEQEAREKLNLQREGEITVVLPKVSSGSAEKVAQAADLPNWQQWWKLFF